MSRSSGLAATLALEGFERIPLNMFRRGPMRKAVRQSGQVVARAARMKIAAKDKGLSGYPAKRTGRLQKSIRVRVSKAGLLAKVYHEKRADMLDFYPAYLHYGTSQGIEAKDNWIEDALADNRDAVKDYLSQGLAEALK